jgi:3',5'-cyclic AMP phosphodiesterase CpdA
MNKNILIWSLLTIIISCSDNLADEPKGEPDYGTGNNPPLTFAVISDIHFGNEVAEGPMVKVPQALKNITSYGELDAMVVVGDLTNGGEPQQYEQLLETFNNPTMFTNPVKNFYFTMGNHDNYASNGKANFQNYLKQFNNGEPYPLNDYRVLKGYPFITVSMLNNHTHDIEHPSNGTNAYPASTLTWLEEALAKAGRECPGRPIFVFTHVPPRWTCYATWTEYENGVAWCMQPLNPVLNKYPQAIVFAGHSHYPVGDPRSIHQGANPNSPRNNYYTVINTGSTTYAEIHPGAVDAEENGMRPFRFAYVTEGLIVKELPNGDIEIRRYDTYRNVEIAADKPWVVKAPFDGSQFTYADIRDANDNPLKKTLYSGGNAPEFPKDTELSLFVASTSVKVTIPQATDDDCVFRYAVKAYDTAGACVGSASVFSRFYLTTEMPATLDQRITGLKPKTEYRVEVTAYDSYENASETLTATFTTN